MRWPAVCAVWLVGLGIIYWLTPSGHPVLSQPYYEVALGFLNDNRTLVTAPADWTLRRVSPVSDTGRHLFAHVKAEFKQVLHLVDVRTGRRRDITVYGDRMAINMYGGRIWVREQLGDPGAPKYRDRLSNIDPLSGRHRIAIDRDWQDGTWYISPDGSAAAYAMISGSRLECYNLASGEKLWARDCSMAPDRRPCFSADAKLLAAQDAKAIIVLEVRTGRTVARLRCTKELWPVEFSPDGQLLLDSDGFIWNVPLAKPRFQAVAKPSFNAAFSPNGQAVMALVNMPSTTELRFYDAESGKEISEGRVTLWRSQRPRLMLYWPAEHREILWVDGYEEIPVLEKLVARVNGSSRLAHQDPKHVYMLIDPHSGQPIVSGHSHLLALSKDGHYLVTRSDVQMQLWELPLRIPWRTMCWRAGAWSIAVFAGVWLLLTISRRRGHLTRTGLARKA
jgi:WD40 repeat protein